MSHLGYFKNKIIGQKKTIVRPSFSPASKDGTAISNESPPVGAQSGGDSQEFFNKTTSSIFSCGGVS